MNQFTTVEMTGGKVTYVGVPDMTTVWSMASVPASDDVVVIPRNMRFTIPYASLLGGIAWTAFWYAFAVLTK